MFKKLTALMMFATVLLTGCSSGSESAMNLDAAGFQSKTQEAGVVVLDVRTRGEFNEGHIANAINIDVESDSFMNEIAKLDKSKTYAVYCRSGRRSADAVAKMSNEQFISLAHLNGGVIDWSNAGLPLVTP
jgi:rhodanese-related sulfurtransferase